MTVIDATYRERPRTAVLGFLTALSISSGDARAAQSWLLELMAIAAFANPEPEWLS